LNCSGSSVFTESSVRKQIKSIRRGMMIIGISQNTTKMYNNDIEIREKKHTKRALKALDFFIRF
jgi:hypothetical protein